MQLPEYAFVTTDQVSKVRGFLIKKSPHMMTVKDQTVVQSLSARGAQHSTVEPSLSPIQAAYVVHHVIQQKLLNPAFQVSPSEWKQQDNQRQQAGPTKRSDMASKLTIADAPQRQQELTTKVALSFSGNSDVSGRLHQMLDDLGVER
ncbi:MAG: hypothetical protein DMG65_23745 [Candidatus Angelobacter sp. Gp1-AA117]|nr:MAG: hypothetical protein DMG65_23745 [Candidatus Angelobacter sp. Gp1-AA117]